MTPTLPLALGCARRYAIAPCDVADHLIVRHAARRAHPRAEIVGAAGAFAEIEMRGDRRRSRDARTCGSSR